MRIAPLIALAGLLTLTACGQSADTTAQLEAMQASADAAASQNLKDGEAYLADIAKQPGIIKLPSGVMYRIVSRAANPGAQPTINDTVKINYEGKLLNGHVFDSSYARNEPAEFPLGRLVPAWQEVIPLLHVGDEVTLYTPPSQGYGERDMGEIPPNSTLIFRIQLLGVQGK
jgi:peptidylprolyl isomerase/FKBP-type peptidyl-prolyl cis-trans isomerase FklB